MTAVTDSGQGQVAAGALAKAATLIEALPWLERFHGQTVVIKFGGHAMTDEALCFAFAQDVVFLRYAGLQPVVVHGGGPQISEHLGRLGIESTFAAGLRVTTRETMDVVRMVLTGQVNRDIVGRINRHGAFAVGMSGEDANLLTAIRAQATVDGAPVDLGQVGEIRAVEPGAVRALIADGRIPVISSVARGDAGEVYNVNADTAAAAVAVALGAAKLVLLTDVAGLYPTWPPRAKGAPPRRRAAVPRCTEERGSLRPSDEGNAAPQSGPEAQENTAQENTAQDKHSTPISQLDAAELAAMLPGLDGGMIPKMEACLTAVRGGVPQAHVIDGRLPHAILLEIFTDSGIGTMVVPEEEAT
jgi:acetylglutamate kinase